MSSTAMNLSKDINALCTAKGKNSSAQFYQLMHEHDDDERIPSVRLSLLNPSEVEHILCLEPAKNNQGLNSFPTVPLPVLLIKNLAMTDGALTKKISAKASMRWRMNNFLLFAFNITTDSRSEESRLLEIHHEPKWLSEYPCYALWYGDEDEVASSVVVAQSKRLRGSGEGIAEVLGYMGEYVVLLLLLYCSLANLAEGFVYHHRKNANKENCPFVTATLDCQVDLEKAFSLLVYVLKETMMVPLTQPKEPSTQSDRGEGSGEPHVPAGSSLRRKLDKKKTISPKTKPLKMSTPKMRNNLKFGSNVASKAIFILFLIC
ncbi:hypothetical protein N7463_000732 [Penicillium fimorum]|uniref:Uncharacterized protein n=1 Tax=Penicillium fimorum TaxID=1882269 RepID=A0A9W9Y4Z2_9EURO|nr:hypothetical protein N7463_000732 [Penicillium fimorum]